MRTLNLGILAHVDAGKTTLTERLLFTAGAIDHVGSVDAGTTQTDSLDLERERGITIRSAVASFLVGDLAVNLVDTPGHPDFIAEVERVLGVLDGAVLVVSAVEGVQPQTPLLFRALQRLRVPTLIFVNKIDRAGADPDRRPRGDGAAARRPAIVPMGAVRDAGPTRRRPFVPVRPPTTRPIGPRSTEVLAEHDEAILRAYVARRGRRCPYPRLRAAARRADAARPSSTRCSSARPRRGIGDRRRCSPASTSSCRRATRRPGRAASRAACSRSSGRPSGERVAYVRLFAGTLRPRQRVRVGGGEEAKPTSIKVFAPAGAPRRDVARRRRDGDGPRPRRGPGRRRDRRAAAGRGGDGALPAAGARGRRVRAASPEQQGSLRAALAQLAEQDPLIDVRQDDHRHEIAVSLYGEVQKEVIQATLERDYGIAADFRETTTVCIERPARRRRGRGGHPREDAHEHHRPELAAEHEPVHGDAGASGSSRRRSAPGIEFRQRRRAAATSRSTCSRRPRRSSAQMEAYVREALSRGPRRLAGDRLPGHDDRLRLRLAGHDARPTSGG